MNLVKPSLPQRTKTHVTDTRAVRQVLQTLPDNLLVRSLEERDYGIDLQLERFEDDRPTGQLALIQVKGTADKFLPQEVSLDFPVRTIEYARPFEIPFFVFYVSTQSKETRFVGLQSYVKLRLNKDSPKWRKQKTATIRFDVSSRLDAKGWELVEAHINQQTLRKQVAELFKILDTLKRFGQYSIVVKDYPRDACIEAAKNLLPLELLLVKNWSFDQKDIQHKSNNLVKAFTKAETLNEKEKIKATKLLNDVLDSMDTVVMHFLSEA